MRKYDYEEIDKLLQPIMEMMREEFPNDCKLIVGADFSEIVFEHTYLTFQSEEMKKTLCETEIGKTFIKNCMKAMERVSEHFISEEEEEE